MRCQTCRTGMRHLINQTYICDTCELISLDTKPDVSVYDAYYLEKYKRYANTDTGKKLNKLRVNFVKKVATETAPTVLDFGCGAGSFILFGNSQGLVVKGFDINPRSDFTDISVLFGNYSVVTMFDSIEHVTYPKKILEGLSAKAIVISTPNYNTFCNRSNAEKIVGWKHYYPVEHIHLFNERSLTKLLRSVGYNIKFVSYAESKYRKSEGEKNILTIGGIRNGRD